MEPTKFVEVKAIRLKNKYWRYFGITKEGTEVVIRGQAKRFYGFAFQYSQEAGVGFGQSRVFTFSSQNRPNPYFANKLIHRFYVTTEPENGKERHHQGKQ